MSADEKNALLGSHSNRPDFQIKITSTAEGTTTGGNEDNSDLVSEPAEGAVMVPYFALMTENMTVDDEAMNGGTGVFGNQLIHDLQMGGDDG